MWTSLIFGSWLHPSFSEPLKNICHIPVKLFANWTEHISKETFPYERMTVLTTNINITEEKGSFFVFTSVLDKIEINYHELMITGN